MLQIGDTGPQVVILQQQLGVTADGIFGDETRTAVIRFQNANGLEPDGIVGPLTHIKLVQKLAPPTSATPPMPKSTSILSGLDIYHDDNVTSWKGLVHGGASFIAIKATEGTSYQDPTYIQNMAMAKSVGLIRGAYHFIHLDQDPVAQAQFFANFAEKAGLTDSDFVMLDWETTNGDPYSVAFDAITVQSFLEQVKKLLGRRCFVYVGYSMVNAINNPSFLAEYPFWLADYNSHPTVPAPWTTWNVWQKSGSATIEGLGNEGDLDVFQGDINDLKALIAYCNV